MRRFLLETLLSFKNTKKFVFVVNGIGVLEKSLKDYVKKQKCVLLEHMHIRMHLLTKSKLNGNLFENVVAGVGKKSIINQG